MTRRSIAGSIFEIIMDYYPSLNNEDFYRANVYYKSLIAYLQDQLSERDGLFGEKLSPGSL
ncbi:MAG: hypothetical protein Q8J68_01300 [Methanolobus sp.]|uniref:hypothetical protein n=1 Tax=Methanolobus sp. TaxID=1874737 RepID=UPI0027319E2E|nr:hypothetical protein [Methanolobus sp.]MDP2215917.1 hypothetical protein [Methanolobus sp.]